MIPTARAVSIDAIASALSPFKLESAMEASRRMFAGEIDRPFLVEEHLTIVAKDCRDRAPRPTYTGNQRTCRPLYAATDAERAEARSIIAECRQAVTQAWEARFDHEEEAKT
jgi:CTP:molybdopterin cytidylyltransferase MocA